MNKMTPNSRIFHGILSSRPQYFHQEDNEIRICCIGSLQYFPKSIGDDLDYGPVFIHLC